MDEKVYLDRVEVIERQFSKKGFCIKERIEYWFPEDDILKERQIGFSTRKPKK
jgi:hypothetical protein